MVGWLLRNFFLLFPLFFFASSHAETERPHFLPQELDGILWVQKEEIIQSIRQFPYQEYSVFFVPTLGHFYLDSLDDGIKNHIRSGEVWEPVIGELIRKYAVSGSTVLDIGAHIGTHTLTMSQSVGPKGKVIAFEPQPKIFRELFLNMALNSVRNVFFYCTGVGERVGKIELSPLTPGNEGGTGLWGGTGQFADLIPIDSLGLNDVSLMKIDVEGQEDAVLNGAKDTILRNKPVILIEIMGGFDIDTAPDHICDAIRNTIHKMEALGYSMNRIGSHDYLALPNTSVHDKK